MPLDIKDIDINRYQRYWKIFVLRLQYLWNKIHILILGQKISYQSWNNNHYHSGFFVGDFQIGERGISWQKSVKKCTKIKEFPNEKTWIHQQTVSPAYSVFHFSQCLTSPFGKFLLSSASYASYSSHNRCLGQRNIYPAVTIKLETP